MYQKSGDDSSLLRRYQTTQDLHARDELVLRYLPLVRSLAKRYSYTSEPLDDLSLRKSWPLGHTTCDCWFHRRVTTHHRHDRR